MSSNFTRELFPELHQVLAGLPNGKKRYVAEATSALVAQRAYERFVARGDERPVSVVRDFRQPALAHLAAADSVFARLVREHRGDSHTAAWTSAGLTAIAFSAGSFVLAPFAPEEDEAYSHRMDGRGQPPIRTILFVVGEHAHLGHIYLTPTVLRAGSGLSIGLVGGLIGIHWSLGLSAGLLVAIVVALIAYTARAAAAQLRGAQRLQPTG